MGRLADDKTFSKALRAYERKNRGWIDGGIGMQIRVLLNGAEVSTVNRAHRKRGVIEVAILDSNGHPVIAGEEVLTKFMHGKVKLTQFQKGAA